MEVVWKGKGLLSATTDLCNLNRFEAGQSGQVAITPSSQEALTHDEVIADAAHVSEHRCIEFHFDPKWRKPRQHPKEVPAFRAPRSLTRVVRVQLIEIYQWPNGGFLKGELVDHQGPTTVRTTRLPGMR